MDIVTTSLPHLTVAVPLIAILQINFESRLGAPDMGNDCLMTINGTDIRILQKGAARKENAFGSFKYHGKSALCSELRVDIIAGNLVWVSGPYPTGKYTDVAISYSIHANASSKESASRPTTATSGAY